MAVKTIFNYPGGKDKVEIKGFKLEPRCYVCGAGLKAEEMENKGIFKYSDSAGNCLGTVEAYVCFNCIGLISGRRK